MTPEAFAAKWARSRLKERSAAQEHFIDLCRLLALPTPAEADPLGESYTFERPVEKVTGGKGFADVWRRGAFAWEYKGKHKDLKEAYLQLLAYREDLGNPPLMVVSDLDTIQVHTNFTGTQKAVRAFSLEDLKDDGDRALLRKVWTDPSFYDPSRARDAVTRAAVDDLLKVADALKARGRDPDETAHFLVKVVFTLFAEDAGLLPRRAFTQLLEAASERPADFKPMAEQLFSLMAKGGLSLVGRVPHFNGGVFADASAPELRGDDLPFLRRAAGRDWARVEPSIFGTLFERVIDPRKRAQIGAHYTPPADILDVIEPVVLEPLRREWAEVRAEVEPLVSGAGEQTGHELEALAFQQETPLWAKARGEARARLERFQNRLAGVTVLDPAMGGGNFLYLTLRRLLDLESEVRATMRLLEPGRPVPVKVGPRQMRGLELSRYAHEIAGMVLWIGYLQWLEEHGEGVAREPVLEPLPGLENRDAALDPDTGKAAEWPEAEFIVGNPPFLGDKKLRRELGDEYVNALRRAYENRLPGGADLVCYWVEQARAAVEDRRTKRAGLITTNSIRGRANRRVLERVKATGDLYMAWADRLWTQEGANVRVSVVAFDDGSEHRKTLDGRVVLSINADLTSDTNLGTALPLPENAGVAYIGLQKTGPFDIPGDLARSWLALPNPTGKPNSDVVLPYLNGADVVARPSDGWLIDFGLMGEAEAEGYAVPFDYVRRVVKPVRASNRQATLRERWWTHEKPRPAMRRALAGLERYIVTPTVSRHRVWVFVRAGVLPDKQLVVVSRDDDFTFGVLNSSAHEAWSLRQSTRLGVGNDPRYTPSTAFETFPFPRPAPEARAAVERAARHLDASRAHLLARGRTLTEVYNALEEARRDPSPTRETYGLLLAHEALDRAVHDAYGWPYPLEEEEVLGRLLALNLERAAEGGPPLPAGGEAVGPGQSHEGDPRERLA